MNWLRGQLPDDSKKIESVIMMLKKALSGGGDLTGKGCIRYVIFSRSEYICCRFK